MERKSEVIESKIIKRTPNKINEEKTTESSNLDLMRNNSLHNINMNMNLINTSSFISPNLGNAEIINKKASRINEDFDNKNFNNNTQNVNSITTADNTNNNTKSININLQASILQHLKNKNKKINENQVENPYDEGIINKDNNVKYEKSCCIGIKYTIKIVIITTYMIFFAILITMTWFFLMNINQINIFVIFSI